MLPICPRGNSSSLDDEREREKLEEGDDRDDF